MGTTDVTISSRSRVGGASESNAHLTHIRYITREVHFLCPGARCRGEGSLNMVVDTGSNTTIVDSAALAELCPKCDSAFERSTTGTRKVAFPLKVVDIPELNMTSGSIMVANGSSVALGGFVAGSMNIRDAIPRFPVGVDGILGSNALSKFAVVVSPKGERIVVTNSFNPSTKHVEIPIVVTDPDGLPGGDLGDLFLAKTSMGNLLLDTGNQASMFCTGLSQGCKRGDNVTITMGEGPPGDPDDPDQLVMAGVKMVTRAPPQSLNQLNKDDPDIQVGGNIGINIMRDKGVFREFVIDFGRKRAMVIPAKKPWFRGGLPHFPRRWGDM